LPVPKAYRYSAIIRRPNGCAAPLPSGDLLES